MSNYSANLIILLISVLTGLTLGFFWRISDTVTAEFVLSIIALCCIAVFAMCAFANHSAPDREKWTMPNLNAKAEGVVQPLQLYWFSALSFAALALGSLLSAFFTPRGNVSFVLFSCISIGVWLGVKISAAYFSKRVSRGEELDV